MSDKDWTDLGNNIRDMVDDAVKSQDFRRLNENICRTVTDGLDTISRNIKKNIGYGENQGPYQNNNGQWGPPYSNGPAGPQAGPDGSNPGGPYQNGAGGWQQGNPAQGAPGQGAPWGRQNGIPYGTPASGQWQYGRPAQRVQNTLSLIHISEPTRRS